MTTAYKALNKDWTCRGFKYEVGRTYKHDGEVVICKSGFHACEDPFDCLSYYNLADSRFAEVELSGVQKRHANDTKIAAAEITIKAELTLPEFIRRSVEWLIEATKGSPGASSGDYSAAASSGYRSKAASSGRLSTAASSGDGSTAAVDGENCAAAAVGINAKAQGSAGAWLAVTEYDETGKCVGFATGCIGQDGLKENTWYIAKGGKLEEVK